MLTTWSIFTNFTNNNICSLRKQLVPVHVLYSTFSDTRTVSEVLYSVTKA